MKNLFIQSSSQRGDGRSDFLKETMEQWLNMLVTTITTFSVGEVNQCLVLLIDRFSADHGLVYD